MKHLAFAIALPLVTSCVAGAGLGLPGSIPVRPGSVGIGVLDIDTRAAGEDEHWFTDDDYLVSKSPYDNRKLTGLHVAKLTAVATNQTNTEARFLVADGRELWTATYWKTRVATRLDLYVGNLAFCNGGPYDRSIEAPRKKREARQDAWILAPITDVSDLYKERVTVGDASCEVKGIRVPTW